MSRRDVELVELDGVFVRESQDAVLFELVRVGKTEPEKIWIPKSLLMGNEIDGWEIPLWLAEKESLV